MNKYILSRLTEGRSKPSKSEIVAVEYGNNIFEVAETLRSAVRSDLSAMPEHSGFETGANEPEDSNLRKKWPYEILGIVYPDKGEKNILVDYVVSEDEAAPGEGPEFS